MVASKSPLVDPRLEIALHRPLGHLVGVARPVARRIFVEILGQPSVIDGDRACMDEAAHACTGSGIGNGAIERQIGLARATDVIGEVEQRVGLPAKAAENEPGSAGFQATSRMLGSIRTPARLLSRVGIVTVAP